MRYSQYVTNKSSRAISENGHLVKFGLAIYNAPAAMVCEHMVLRARRSSQRSRLNRLIINNAGIPAFKNILGPGKQKVTSRVFEETVTSN